MKLLKTSLQVIAVAMALFGLFLVYSSVTEYKPKPIETIIVNQNPELTDTGDTLNLLTWNIGYCGLDAGMDFFYDGGTKVRTPQKQVQENLQSIIRQLGKNDSLDFILLQEVDKKSKRSYFMDEYDSICTHLSGYHPAIAKNYIVSYVIVPLTSPMGKVDSGILTLSKSNPSQVTRHSYPGSFAWPKSLMMLKRCFLVNRYPLKNGKELLVINTHNSAYDKGGFLKKQELNFFRGFLTEEFSKGNYIIAGGDWNQSPFGLNTGLGNYDNENGSVSRENFIPAGWKYAYCDSAPSNRSITAAYEEGRTPTSVIDYFVLSPNIEALSVRTIHLKFRNSDHNPVVLKVRFSTRTENLPVAKIQ